MKILDQLYPERSLVHSPYDLNYLLIRRVNELGMTGVLWRTMGEGSSGDSILISS
jgi:hypothetical protein